VEDSLSSEAAGYSVVDKKVFREALGMRMNELLHTQGAIRLLKAQLTSVMPGIYLGLLLPLLIVMALVLLEIGLAGRYGWCRAAVAPTGANPLAQTMHTTPLDTNPAA